MKLYIILVFACTASFLFACSNNNTTKETAKEENSAPAATTAAAESKPTSGDGITGNWKLSLEAYDDNSNGKLDDEERSKGIQNRYSFRFNDDGTCQIMNLYKGRYEVKEENGKKVLSVYRQRIEAEEDKDPAPDVYRIISLGNDELVLLETIGNHTFWVFKRSV